jgi:predicted P-loop ATPase/phage/plasmid primase-like uncharacterized protein
LQDFIQEFSEFIESYGHALNERLIGDDKWRRARVNGERGRDLRYQLYVSGDYAMGRFIYSKDGICHGWHSKNTKDLTQAERDSLNARIEADKMANEAKEKNKKLKAAEKAATLWAACGPADTNHEYCVRKGIEPLGAKQNASGSLVLPIYSQGRLKSLQFIAPDGSKRFLFGGDCVGYASLVFKNDSKDTIVIVEGYATGVSVRMATGLPVIVAYNAGNLKPVTAEIRKKFPDSRLIIAADNDAFTVRLEHRKDVVDYKNISGDDRIWQEWRDEGFLLNTGIEKAVATALECDCDIAWPEFQAVKDKPTDFNDLHALEGLEVVKNRILQAEVPPRVDRDGGQSEPVEDDAGDHHAPVPPDYFNEIPDHIYEEVYSEDTQRVRDLYSAGETETKAVTAKDEEMKDWKERLHLTDKGGLTPTSLSNIDLILRYHDKFKDLFCYDEFSQEKTLVSCPPWEAPDKFKVRPLKDEDNTRLAIELEQMGLKPSLANLKKVLDSVVIKKPRHPAREYFSKLEWDGVKRLDNWLAYYCGAEEDDPNYIAAIGRKWMVAAVTRVFRPGAKFDHMLIFEGTQDAGKSYMLKELSTIHGRAYFDDTIKVSDLGNDKTVPKMQGVLIIEIAELSGFRKKDSDELKQAITTQSDRIVRKYANEPSEYPRQFVLAGTVNPTDGYLHDVTGNRRFWPVKVADKLDVKALANDKEQLWAEAVHLFKKGEKLYLEDELKELAKAAQEKRNTLDPWMPTVKKVVERRTIVTSDDLEDVWTALGVKMLHRDKYTNARLGKIMSALGFKWGRPRVGGARPSAWVKIDHKEQEEIEF